MGVKGNLRDMALADIVYILHVERRSAAVHLASETGYGAIFLKDGEVIHASYRNLSGTEAFYHFLTWKEGDFELETNPALPSRTIEDPVQSLLLEGVKRLDESRPRGADLRNFTGDTESLQLLERLLALGILEKIEVAKDAAGR